MSYKLNPGFFMVHPVQKSKIYINKKKTDLFLFILGTYFISKGIKSMELLYIAFIRKHLIFIAGFLFNFDFLPSQFV